MKPEYPSDCDEIEGPFAGELHGGRQDEHDRHPAIETDHDKAPRGEENGQRLQKGQQVTHHWAKDL